MANGTKELHTSPITIEDEINEFSEKPVQGKTLYKKLKELEDGTLPDASEASAGNALVLDADKKPTWGEAGGGGAFVVTFTVNLFFNTVSADKTPFEIVEAFRAGYNVMGIYASGTAQNEIYRLSYLYWVTSNVILIEFTRLTETQDGPPRKGGMRAFVYNGGSWRMDEFIFDSATDVLLYSDGNGNYTTSSITLNDITNLYKFRFSLVDSTQISCTTVSVLGIGTHDVIIKDNLTGNLYKADTSTSSTALTFTPYTPGNT